MARPHSHQVAFSDASSGIFLRQFPVALSRPVRSEPISAFPVPADRAAPVARATLAGSVTTTQSPESLCTWENALTCRHIVLWTNTELGQSSSKPEKVLALELCWRKGSHVCQGDAHKVSRGSSLPFPSSLRA